MKGEDIKAYKVIHHNDFAYNPARINVGSIAKYNGYEPCMISSLYVCFKANNEVNEDWLMHLLRTPKVQYYYQLNGEGGVRIYLFYPNFARIRTSIPSIEEQKKIAKILSIIDERIATQNKIIEDLKKLKSAIIDIVIGKSDFPKIRFEEIYDRAGEGGTPATSTQEYYLNGKIPFVKIEDLANKYLVSSKDFITELGLCKSSTWVVPTNSIIYSNGATIGAISINKIPVCTKQGILGIVPKEKYHVEYLYYLMTTTYFRKQIERIVTEGTMRTAYLKDINHIECPIPDLETQKKIASMLRNLSNKLELEQSILTNHTNQKRFVLSSMFI